MPDRLSLHAPILVNTIGHCAGAIAFGILFYLLLLDWRRATAERSLLPSIAAALAFLWNMGSLIGMATAPVGDPIADTIIAGSFSVLSLLPAVLLHISLQSRHRFIWIGGYAVSAIAVVLHIGDLATGAPRFHYAAILLVTIGFTVLTTASVIQEALSGAHDGSGKRLAGAMVLFLFAMSFAHFGSTHDIKAWSGEAALHHAGIPLALFVLLQDYRFLLLDAFIRFLLNGALAALAIWLAFTAEVKLSLVAHATRDPFYGGIVFTVACLVLSLFGYLRVSAQKFLTHAVFLRSSSEKTFSKLREIATTCSSDLESLASAADAIAQFFSTTEFEVSAGPATEKAMAVPDPARSNVPKWVQAMVPLRFSRGDGFILLLGPRKGGRRYLSEDLEMLERLAAVTCEQVERIRSSEMLALVSQAELRALQAQINPHFFFNALNALYGVIPRENSIARGLVLNLADLFRHSFGVSSSLSALSEEIRIVRAYLEIEEIRLGSRLRTEFDIDESALSEKVPVLSIQPLVENAVQHGVACRPGNGFVRLTIRRQGESILVAVSNSGVFGAPPKDQGGHGIGMANVRRRLSLCCGESSDLQVSTAGDVTTVRFLLPARNGHPAPMTVA
ncbi:MAG: histidine kinase [Acidobacteriota bacterium]|nr:histidine kinase [Acidobacteriota bacterium]